MHPKEPHRQVCCPGIGRRAFLADLGMGFSGLVLGSMLFRDGLARAAATGRPHFPPRAKSVIWFFMTGGACQLETFDPKPALNRYAGKTIAETPYGDTLKSPFLRKNLREMVPGLHNVQPKLLP